MKIEKIDFFQPFIIVVAIVAFLAMGYVGSFNYRFEDPLKLDVILTILFSCLIFTIGIIGVKCKISIEKTKELNFLSERLLLILVIIALILQTLNMVLLGGIPLFDSVSVSNVFIVISLIIYRILSFQDIFSLLCLFLSWPDHQLKHYTRPQYYC